ncbi:hypothetical protein BZG36_03241 [Bifiguratus adelaidae]|uniref:GH18 domain-containing protein n=1 Tax=Bifiguratus adelaidae TaxID=1938954 RepID=A0A261Y015_9FUNG|nr:hypothetical protein BZG36_03241 [Bifiguratus adelaidae]
MFSSAQVVLVASVFLSLASVLAAHPRRAYGRHALNAYVVDWDVDASKVPYTSVDHIIYAFGIPDAHGNIGQFSGSTLSSVVNGAHKHNVGVSLAIGGWSGSIYFSNLVKSAGSRATFVKNLVNLVKHYDLNGLNIDWEYPASQNGVACNTKSADDTAHLLTFLQELRSALDQTFRKQHVILTAATSLDPFNDRTWNPSTQLPGFNNVLDQVYIMAYDINGNWNSITGPAAPLYEPGHGLPGSGASAVAAWHKAGIPLNKIVLGVPFYGWTTKTSHNGLYGSFSKTQIPGDQYDTKSRDCGAKVATYSGEFQWRSLAAQGVDQSRNGWQAHYDTKTQTAWAYNTHKQQLVTYDDARTCEAKAKYAKQHGLGGVLIWSLEMDDSHHTLLTSLQLVR